MVMLIILLHRWEKRSRKKKIKKGRRAMLKAGACFMKGIGS